eukprot:CAMPEP_0170459030 /NCGR_PEP_ID=MMETSP0123-20130129/5834_1 /TAXON_ID=182087 /ORGANISM="Favella ehrenbergii, Strain Fehren 1" /LENGTH=49 /DNA_ID=CAMNT_0010723439 /DNA_START=304 /DNA_END=453 /DNA_ORIENTATION=+
MVDHAEAAGLQAGYLRWGVAGLPGVLRRKELFIYLDKLIMSLVLAEASL